MAGAKPVPAYMKLYDTIMKQSPQLPSVAPRHGRAGQRQTAMPQRAGLGDAAGLPGLPRTPGAAPGSIHKIIAAAKAQTVQAKAQREAGRAALGLPARGVDLSKISFAPMPRNGAASSPARAGLAGMHSPRGLLAAGDAGQGGESLLAAAGQHAPQGLPPRRQPAPGGNGGALLHEGELVLAELSPFALGRAIENYFLLLTRRPPIGGAAFNTLVSPLFAGQALPG